MEVLGHYLHGVGTVGLVDAHRARCADRVAVQHDHDLADELLLRLSVDDPPGPQRTDAGAPRSQSGSASIMSNTFAPNALTSFLA